MDSMTIQQVRQLYEVEGLSLRQSVQKLQVPGKAVSRIIRDPPLKKPSRKLLCQPYDRVIRDLKDFLKITPCQHLCAANGEAYFWRQERNQRIHRSTDKNPLIC